MDPPNASILQSDVAYEFKIRTVNNLPGENQLWFKVPAGITIPNPSALKITCLNNSCMDTNSVIKWDPSTRILNISVKHWSGALPKGSDLWFKIKGFTTPSTTTTQVWDFATNVIINSQEYKVD